MWQPTIFGLLPCCFRIVTCVPSSTHPYFRESTLAALVDLGGSFEAKLHPFIGKKWSELSPADRQVGWR